MSQINKKLVTVGDNGVGKTTLLTVYATDTFPEWPMFNNWECSIEVNDQSCQLALWDTVVNEYNRLRPLSYPDTSVLLLLFSLVDRESYDNVESKWYPELNRYIPDVPIILVGTKLDLRDDKEQESRAGDSLSMEDGFKMWKKNDNVVKYMECSSLTRQGVNEVFEEAARIALKYKQGNTHNTSTQQQCIFL